MRRYFYDPPGIVKNMFRDFAWNTVNDKVLLTFDDGPTPDTTPAILEELDRLNIKAVFFCVGENIYKNIEMTGQILSAGHVVGNHTYNHKRVTGLTRTGLEEQIVKVNELYKSHFGSDLRYFRAPHGRFNFALCKALNELGMVGVEWSLLTYDYENNLDKVQFAVDKYVAQNSIIVLHDSLKSKDIIIDSIRHVHKVVNEKGYQIGIPQECLR